MKKGFTLPEVLITIVIIGIVAALTIPLLVDKYQKYQYYTKFMKAYNTLQTAYSLSVAEHGEPGSWSQNDVDDEDSWAEWTDEYFFQYMKNGTKCGKTPENCGIDKSEKMRFLNKNGSEENGATTLYTMISGNSSLGVSIPTILLPDGVVVSIIALKINQAFNASFIVDINGIDEPNKFGRDIFAFEIGELGGKLYPKGTLKCNSLNCGYSTMSDFEDGSNDGFNCSSSVTSQGKGCAARLVQEHKMNY